MFDAGHHFTAGAPILELRAPADRYLAFAQYRPRQSERIAVSIRMRQACGVEFFTLLLRQFFDLRTLQAGEWFGFEERGP